VTIPPNSISLHPDPPRAGQSFVTTFYAQANNRLRLPDAIVTCTATVGTATIGGAGSYESDGSRCVANPCKCRR
jgi:hypothetical protein